MFSHTAAQGDELEWKGRKQRPDRNAGSNRAGDEGLHPWRIYICCVASSTQAEECVVLHQSQGVIWAPRGFLC